MLSDMITEYFVLCRKGETLKECLSQNFCDDAKYICIGRQWKIYALVNTERKQNTLNLACAGMQLTAGQCATNFVLGCKVLFGF
jgi:hypothetical protein